MKIFSKYSALFSGTHRIFENQFLLKLLKKFLFAGIKIVFYWKVAWHNDPIGDKSAGDIVPTRSANEFQQIIRHQRY
jgi:hypothetical protein